MTKQKKRQSKEVGQQRASRNLGGPSGDSCNHCYTFSSVWSSTKYKRSPAFPLPKKDLTSHVNTHTAVKSLQSQNSKEKRFFLPQKIDTQTLVGMRFNGISKRYQIGAILLFFFFLTFYFLFFCSILLFYLFDIFYLSVL